MANFFGRLLRFGPVQMIIILIALIVAVILRDVVVAVTGRALDITQPARIWLSSGGVTSASPPHIWQAIIAAGVMIALGYLAYRLCVIYVEKRAPTELMMKGALGGFGMGALVGTAILLSVIAILAVLGMFEVNGRTLTLAVLIPAASAATAAFIEELVFRGVLFRFFEQWFGSWLALAATALLFGMGHASNANATWLSTAAIALMAGVALGAAYMATRTLWVPIGMHFAVNLVQGSVLGLPVSGKESVGLLDSELSGPPLLTGGAFGLEASVLLLPAGAAAIGLFLWLAWQRGRIMSPAWTRRRDAYPTRR